MLNTTVLIVCLRVFSQKISTAVRKISTDISAVSTRFCISDSNIRLVCVCVRWCKNSGIPTDGPTDNAFLGVEFEAYSKYSISLHSQVLWVSKISLYFQEALPSVKLEKEKTTQLFLKFYRNATDDQCYAFPGEKKKL